MLILLGGRVPAHEITDERLFLSRRQFLGALAGTAASLALPGAGSAHPALPDDAVTPPDRVAAFTRFLELRPAPGDTAGLMPPLLRTDRWTVVVNGACRRPRLWCVDDLAPPGRTVEAVRRFRGLDGWSMVIPWQGVPLGDVLRLAEPEPGARWVELTTLYDPRQMPGQRTSALAWPYVEALRLDEATHPLALLATGAYGRALPAASGAPLRLVVPWKHGYKSIKSIVRIRLTRKRPQTSWTRAAPAVRGFWANVDPARPGQAFERRLGDPGLRPTLPFNGYADAVAGMYAGRR